MNSNRLTRADVQPIIERLAGISDHGWTFSDMGLMALISEIEDAVIAKQASQPKLHPSVVICVKCGKPTHHIGNLCFHCTKESRS